MADEDLFGAGMYSKTKIKNPPESRPLQREFLDKYSCSARHNSVMGKNEGDEDKPFFQGFAFKILPNDETFVPEHYKNEYDLFEQFYEKLIDSAVLNHYIEEVENFFEPVGVRKPGCRLYTRNGIQIGSTHQNFNFNIRDVDEKLQSKDMITSKNMDSFGIYTTRIVKAGELVLQEKPLIICKSPNCVCSGHEYFECSYCTRSFATFYACPQCSVAIYCSEKCRDDAYRDYHAFECMANKCHFFGKRNSAWVAFRMLTIGALHKFDYTADNKYATIYATPRHKDIVHLLATLRKAIIILVYLIKYTKFFEFITIVQDCFPDLSLYEKYLKIGGLLIRHLIQAETATLYFPDEMISFTNESKGHSFNTPVLCIQAANFIHACKPNAVVVYCGDTYFIKTIREIPAGSMITINYVNIDQRFYGMEGKRTCICVQCSVMDPVYTGHYYICPHCKAADVMHYPPLFNCQSCGILGPNSELDKNIKKIKKMFNVITEMVSGNYEFELLRSYIVLHDTIYLQYSPEYLYVVQKMVILTLESAEIPKACELAYKLHEVLNTMLNKFSLRKLDILVTIINMVIKLVTNKNVFFSRLNILQLFEMTFMYIKDVYLIADFYLLKTQYDELQAMLDALEKQFLPGKIRDELVREVNKFDDNMEDIFKNPENDVAESTEGEAARFSPEDD